MTAQMCKPKIFRFHIVSLLAWGKQVIVAPLGVL